MFTMEPKKLYRLQNSKCDFMYPDTYNEWFDLLILLSLDLNQTLVSNLLHVSDFIFF